MSGIDKMARQAREHWEEWLPEMTKELKAAGIFSLEAKKAAVRAQREILVLRQQCGYQNHEAEEVILPQYILLEPEDTESTGDADQDAELAEMEREYQENLPLML